MNHSGKFVIFVSSTQRELAAERRAVKQFVETDALLGRYFSVFLFEDIPASGGRLDEVYLDEVDSCALYIGIFGNDYGFEDSEGISPTEREFDRAGAMGKERLIFVKGSDDRARHSKMAALVSKAGAQLIRRRFVDVPDLISAVLLFGTTPQRMFPAAEIRCMHFHGTTIQRPPHFIKSSKATSSHWTSW